MDLKEETGCFAGRMGVEYEGIFNQRASASSAQFVFHRNPSAPNRASAFICVHLRLILDKDGREAV